MKIHEIPAIEKLITADLISGSTSTYLEQTIGEVQSG